MQEYQLHLSTERLIVRHVSLDDAVAMYKYRSDNETSKYLSLHPTSEKDLVDFIGKTERSINIPGSWYQVVIEKQCPHQLIGDIGIHFMEGAGCSNQQVEIGYTLDKNYRKKGYATEALSAILDFLFFELKKHRVSASIDPRNQDSVKLIQRLGFRKEAHHIKSLFFQGKWVDDLIFAMLNNEWAAIRHKTTTL